MHKNIKIYYLSFVFACVLLLNACQSPGGNVTGSEYMPDMAHSIAYEANYYNYYYNNTWGGQEEYYEYAKPRLPVQGTVPHSAGTQPYYYGDSEDERNRAIAGLVDNPFKITDAGLDRGKELYNTFCAICHGEKGDGAGYLVRDDGGVYPVQPSNLLLDEYINTSNGRFYHAIMWGKNLMGAYKDKLSYEERWQVIHHIRSLQAKEKGLVYNQLENTLNSVDVPAGEMAAVETDYIDEDALHNGDGHHDEDHSHTTDGEDHGHDHSEEGEHHGDDH